MQFNLVIKEEQVLYLLFSVELGFSIAVHS